MANPLELPEMFQKIAQENLGEKKSTDTQPTKETGPAAPTNAMSAEQAAAVNEALAALAKDYPAWTAKDMAKIRQLMIDARSIQGEDRENMVRKDLFRIAHNVKGQGATFGYPLMTEIGNHLCRYIESQPEINGEVLSEIKKHVDAMDTILKDKLTGDGGEEGQKLKSDIMGA